MYRQIKQEKKGVTFAYLLPKLDIDFMYNLNNHYNRQGYKLITRHTLNDEIHNISQSTNGENRQLVHTFRLGGNYKFNEQSQLGLSYTSSLIPINNNRLPLRIIIRLPSTMPLPKNRCITWL